MVIENKNSSTVKIDDEVNRMIKDLMYIEQDILMMAQHGLDTLKLQKARKQSILMTMLFRKTVMDIQII